MYPLVRLALITATSTAVSYRLLRIYVAGGVCQSKARLDGKTVIITGANTGIGKTTAIDLAKRGARVIMACRNLQRGQLALREITELSGNSSVILKHLDLSSSKSIRAFAEDVNSNEARLDVLINNAGLISTPKRRETEDGFEITIGVNHLGHFLLTNLLLNLLKKLAPSRVVVVSSDAHYSIVSTRSPFNFENMQGEVSYNNWEAYGQSKLANILFTRELARCLNGTGVTANSLHPGAVTSEIGRYTGISDMVFQVLSLFMKTTQEGAQTTIHLAVAEEVTGVSGKYFTDCKEKEPAKTAQDDLAARTLWQISAELVRLDKSTW